MTVNNARLYLNNTKVYTNGRSKEIQEKLFSLGYHWSDSDCTVQMTKMPFLFINSEDSTITYSNDMEWFIESECQEISVDDILNISIEEYRGFKNGIEAVKELKHHEPVGWIIYNDKYYNIDSLGNSCIYINGIVNILYNKAVDIIKFADGKPFGIKL